MLEARHTPGFVGRRSELEVLALSLELAAASSTRFVLIGGEAGIGKTRLVQEFCEAARRRAIILEGRAPSVIGPSLPYAAIRSVLRSAAMNAAAGGPNVLVPSSSDLSRLLPALGSDPPMDDREAGGPLRLFERVVALFVELSGSGLRPVIVVIEDLQWADASTRQFIAYLTDAVRDQPLLGIFTYRLGDLSANGVLRPLLVEMARTGATQQIELGRLSTAEVAAQIQLITGRTPPVGRVEEIARRSGGNALLVEELVASSGSSATSVGAALLARVGHLPQETQAFVRLASVAGPSVATRILDAAAIRLKQDPATAARAARDALVLEVLSADGMEAYAFRAPLLQEVLYADLLPAERARYHAALGDALLAERGSQSEPLMLLEIARHLWNAGDTSRAAPAVVRAAMAAEQMYAFAEAHLLFERALSALMLDPSCVSPAALGLDSGATDSAEVVRELGMRAAQAAGLSGDAPRAVELMRRILADDGHTPRAAARLATHLWEAGERDEAVSTAKLATLALDSRHYPASERAEVLQAVARTMLLAGRFDEARRSAAEAAAAAGEAGEASRQGRALGTLSAALALSGRSVEAVEALDRARRTEEQGHPQSRIQPRPSRILDLLSRHWSEVAVLDRAGRIEEAATAALDGWRRAQQLGTAGFWRSRLGAAAARTLVELGRWREADEVLRALAPDGQPLADAESLIVQTRLRTRQGDFEAAANAIEKARAEVHPGDSELAASLALAAAELALWRAQPAAAARTVNDAIRDASAATNWLGWAELALTSLRASADLVVLATESQAPVDRFSIEHLGTELHAQIRAVAAGQADASARVPALLASSDAELARLRRVAEPAIWLSVGDAWTALHVPFDALYARWRAADQLAREANGMDGTGQLIARLTSEANALGATAIQRTLATLARPYVIAHRRTTATEIAPSRGQPSRSPRLSTTEADVLGLFIEGRTTHQIAQSLLDTDAVAERHVTAVLTKLNATSRLQAASTAIGLNLVGTAPPAFAGEPGDERDATREFVCLMFTDIVRSTALIEAIGDEAWADIGRWHDATLRALFVAHAGREVDHAGDGFFVVFDEVPDGAACAVAIQRSLADHRRRHGYAPRVRVGIHASEVTRTGDRYQGRGVHQAARIGSAAAPDEILVSSESVGRLGEGWAKEEARLITAQGLTEPVSVTPIRWR